jgi:membrane protease YdiL (CAAX protease family)
LLGAQGLFELSLLFVAIGVATEWRFQPLGPALRRLGLRRTVPKAFGIALLTLLVYYIAAGLFSQLVLQPEQEDIGGELGVGDPNLLIAVSAVLVIAVVAPVTEELFFRGFVFAGLRSRWSLWPAAVVVGLIFGIVHAPTGLTAVVPLAALGVALCWLYDRTGSLWPCVFAHVINNSLALLVIS